MKLTLELGFEVEQQLSGTDVGLPALLEKCLN